jgi:hypothetical protein
MHRLFKLSAVAISFASAMALLPACYAEATMAPAAPPPPRVVTVVPRAGHVWIDGRWAWNGGQWVWINGHYEAIRVGHRWVPGHWAQTPRGYQWTPGMWVR